MRTQAEEGLVKRAVHQHPAASKRGVMERLFSFWFDSFVYNQIWEDPRVDLQALQLKSDSLVLTIASGGCNVLSYLDQKPESIIALGLNRYHIYLTRLKLAALTHLPTYDDFFNFFGCANASANLEKYQTHLRHHLDEATRNFWEGGTWIRRNVMGPRINYFASNLYNYAKLGYLLRLVHSLTRITRRDPSRILKAETKAEQEKVFNETIAPFFDNKLVRFVGRQPLVMFSLGIPPHQYETMREESSGDVIDLYRERVRRLTCEFPIQDNYFAWQALSRSYDVAGRQAVPEYLKQSGYATRKQHADRVQTVVAPLTDYLRQQPDESLDRFVLLDAQDWMRPEQLTELWTEIARVGRPGTRVIFRTGSRTSPLERALPTPLRSRFYYDQKLSLELHGQDRSAIYGGFHLYCKW
jgi:S-adenosylmethionine-diacylglycerol 3-amino-3-carboxypropyl transferase